MFFGQQKYKKPLLILLAAGAIFTTFVFAVLILYLYSLDTREYKSLIEKQIKSTTGRDFQISGELSLTPSLIPTLKIAGVTFANPSWASSPSMINANSVEAQVALLPLLSGRLEVVKLHLADAVFNFESNQAGDKNWDLAGLSASDTSMARHIQFDVQSVVVHGLAVNYINNGNVSRAVRVEKLTLDKKAPNGALDLLGEFSINGIKFQAEGLIDPLRHLLANENYQLSLAISHDASKLSLNGEIGEPMNLDKFDLAVAFHSPDLSHEHWPQDANLILKNTFELSTRLNGSLRSLTASDLAITTPYGVLDGFGQLSFNETIPSILLELSSGAIDVTPLTKLTGVQNNKIKSRAFSPAPLPFDLVSGLDVALKISLEKFRLHNISATDLKLTALVKNDKLDINELSLALGSGTLSAKASIFVTEKQPVIAIKLNGDRLPIEHLMSAGQTGDSGGRVDLKLDLKGQGRSIQEIMSKANGDIQLDLRDLLLKEQLVDFVGGDLVVAIINGLNPLKTNKPARVECASFHFPINNGVAENKSGIGVRTQQLNILGGGTIHFETEQLSLGANAKPREGIGINLAGLADFVRLGGTITNPIPLTDAKGATVAGLKVGAAIATGGLSLIAEGLLDRAAPNIDVCAIARGDKAISNAHQSNDSKSVINKVGDGASKVTKSVGEAAKKVLKSIFGP